MSNKDYAPVDELFICSFFAYYEGRFAGEQISLEEVWREMGGVGKMPLFDADFEWELLLGSLEDPEEVDARMWETIQNKVAGLGGVPPLPDRRAKPTAWCWKEWGAGTAAKN